jgi:hypothetical protein
MVEAVLYKCPWCPCFFLTSADLERHKQAFRTTGVQPNEYDHRVRWKGELYKRDHEYIES